MGSVILSIGACCTKLRKCAMTGPYCSIVLSGRPCAHSLITVSHSVLGIHRLHHGVIVVAPARGYPVDGPAAGGGGVVFAAVRLGGLPPRGRAAGLARCVGRAA